MACLLHGTLCVTIYDVDKLHNRSNLDFCNKDTPHKTKRFLAQVKACLLCRPELVGTRLYATVDLDKARVARTRVIRHHTSNPKWNETFHIYCAHTVSHIVFTVKDGNPIGATLIGRASVPVDQVLKGDPINTQFQIYDEDSRPIQGGSKIHVKIQFDHVTNDPHWSRGIMSADYPGVPHAFLNQRENCRVTLYQDAHVLNDFIKVSIPLSGGIRYYNPGRCWEDIFKAICNAKHLIYITGWSVYTKITLTRNYGEQTITLGELLLMKAEEGVKVLMLIWDDRTSDNLKKEGLMATHDQETAQYFRNTKVQCILCPRNPDVGRSIIQGLQTSTMFTHHQKAIVVDSDLSGINEGSNEETRKRSIVSFIGGIDLCDGRYDTHEHPLFSTLNTIHQDDFHQPNFSGASIKRGGPREPWHDIHCKLEGPVAWDVLYNFEQRWEKQVRKGLLIPLSMHDQILVSPSEIKALEDNEKWTVQLFRSIDGGAVSGFPKDLNEAAELGLVSGKNNIIDRSIQDAYIIAIRRARNFIYIENQYFLGSSYGWKATDIKVEDIGALHLVPKELSLKIVSKIKARERFVVYIVIPMWPEGDPESASVQAILDWQRRTMEMMYIDIVEAIEEVGSKADPTEYLTFFCLGNREVEKPGEYVPPERPVPGSNYDRAQKARRFMIYVHSKMMIVDDEYIIVGSANINQRSMDGGRDTEIAMGAFQPHHLTEEENRPKGQIHGFRRALWLEHLGDVDAEVLDRPESEDCVKLVNYVTQENWKLYTKETFSEADSNNFNHLLRYPVHITKSGHVTTLEGFEFFTDTKARILGSKSDYLPPILTT
ncbi:phospholipase D alpha 1-like [Prosopis cineraria]|uniref:phospholipase D alpha 1-like n=1 Tax=Prosopis cineraria TaxID=364024 RepID=UPI002410B3EA|nr:phospholipase D alpha 1-like [Prosopis cineraria]XP_054788396.1 phospholipase D alpha 1-like [Prosopis cineraria]